tara:strand:- start:384 stop:560 length:177 start_codon:yes stop_codon:yes gene_type:complete
MSNIPIGGDPVENHECTECDNSELIWEEYGTSESDESFLETFCKNCGDRKEEEDLIEY